MPEENKIILNASAGRMEIAGQDKNTPVFNWALENSEKTKEIYKGIWSVILGSEAGFEEFFVKCQDVNSMALSEDKSKIVHSDGMKISGTTFQTEVIRRLTELDKSRPQEEQQFQYDAKGRLKKDSIKKIGMIALESLNINGVESQSLNHDILRIYLSQMAVDGYLPFDTVATAGASVAEGQHLQMGCGEGKTGVLVFAAAHQAMTNKQVFLTSSTANLASDTMFDTIDKYELMGFNHDKDGSVTEQVVLITNNKVYYPLRDNEGNIVHKDKDGNIVSADKGKPVLTDGIDLAKLTPEERKKVLAEAYSKKIVIADNGTVMQHDMGGLIPSKDANERVLFADEADYVLLDQFRPSQQLGGAYSQEKQQLRQTYRELARKLMLDFKNQYQEGVGYNKDDRNQYCDFTAEGKSVLHSMIDQLAVEIKTKTGLDLDKQLFADLAYEALVVETVYKDTRDYQIVTDENGNKIIISEDRASGASIALPQGIAQALAIKEGASYPAEHQVLNATNVGAVFEHLFGKNQVCVSGTLNTSLSENQAIELKKKTNGSTYDCSARDINSRQMNPKRIFATKDDRRKGTVQSALEHRTQNMRVENGKECYQPVLIGCVSEEEVAKTIEELKTQHSQLGVPKIVAFTATSEHIFAKEKALALKDVSGLEGQEKLDAIEARDRARNAFVEKYGVEPNSSFAKNFNNYVKSYCGMSNSNCIVVGTSILGRGTTVKLGDKDIDEQNLFTTKELGGIHVIINGLHETSSRNQIQYAARAARGEDPGSVDEYMSLDEFDSEILKAKGILVQGGEVFVRRDDGTIAPISQEEIDDLYETQYKAIDDRQSNIRTHIDNLIKNIEAQKATVEDQLRIKLSDGNYSEEEINLRVTMAVSFMTQRGFSILNRACGHDGRYDESEYSTEMNAFANLYVAQYAQPDPNSFDPMKDFFHKEGFKDKYKAVGDSYFDFSVDQKIEILQKEGLSQKEIVEVLGSAGVTKEEIAKAWKITTEALSAYTADYGMES